MTKFYSAFFLALFSPSLFFAFFVGNPAQTSLLKEGLIFKNDKPSYFYSSLFYDQIYKSAYEDSPLTPQSITQDVKLSTLGATLHLNLNRVDFMGFLGTSQVEIENVIKKTDAFLWGLGVAILLWQEQKIYVTLDGKYLQFDPSIDHLLVEGTSYKVITDFAMKFEEWQVGLTLGYRLDPFLPYLGILYEKATINPHPASGLLQIGEDKTDFMTSLAEIKNKIGMVVGCSFFKSQLFTLNLETRFFSEYAYTLSAAFRF